MSDAVSVAIDSDAGKISRRFRKFCGAMFERTVYSLNPAVDSVASHRGVARCGLSDIGLPSILGVCNGGLCVVSDRVNGLVNAIGLVRPSLFFGVTDLGP